MKPWGLTRILRVVALLVLIGLLIGFWTWWASFHYALHEIVCNPEKPKSDCDSYNPLFAYAVSWAYHINYWGSLITAIATGFIAFFTLSLRVSTDKLWRSGERQIKALRQSVLVSIHAAKASKGQAKAAVATVELMRRQLRAVVGIKTASLGHVEGGWLCVLEMLNTGQLSAVSYKFYGAFRFGKDTVQEPLTEQHRINAIMTLAPQLPMHMHITAPDSKVPAGRPKMFVAVRLEYDNGLGELVDVPPTYYRVAKNPGMKDELCLKAYDPSKESE